MFAATTADTLSVADYALLKKAPSSIPSCLDLIEPPTSTSWAPDNSSLFIATESTVQRYDPTTNILRDVYTYNGAGGIQSLAPKDKNTAIFAAENDVHVLDCSGSDTKITQTFASHTSPITSLSLSNDVTLLASSSFGQVHVHNLTLGSHTVLRGLPPTKMDSVVFHPHSRTRLLVASERQIFIYDTTRPSNPLKIITLTEATTGDIISVACSPFSKTLVATATSEGFVALLDLEKEKSLVRTVNMKVTLSTIDFTTEGGAMYLGTNTGKVLILDLRLLDKPPKSIVISQHGNPVKTISVQKKAKSSTDGNSKAFITNATTKSSVEPLPSGRRATSSASTQSLKAASRVAPSPARARAGKLPSTTTPIQRRGPSALKEAAPASSPTAGKTAAALRPKKVLSPSRDPLGNSLSGQSLRYVVHSGIDLIPLKARSTNSLKSSEEINQLPHQSKLRNLLPKKPYPLGPRQLLKLQP
ncbi:WD40-repeat-containing domain protein [Crepidotus variabilis]|uniref:WD40-repeat-containing domain protein n=1 Tax=Crepidotus variabilis TaxID=179855 RepID=A0A9P6EQ51_9AGAR|nr:WD40-repeat-containing domain protein [Crepidotus variabilis]